MIRTTIYSILFFRRPRHRHLRGVEYIFNENAVARGQIVDEHVGHRADKLSVLDNGRAAQ